MQRETTKITLTTLARIARRIEAGAEDDYEVADTVVRGLIVRLRKRSAKWALRCKVAGAQHYFTIGSIVALKDPDVVRMAAEKAKALLREGGNPTLLFESLIQTSTLEDAEARAAHRDGKVWDWDHARERFLAACREHNRKDTVRTYKSASGLPDIAVLRGKIITQITPDDIRRVRDAIRSRGKVEQSKLTMRTLKALFGWLTEQPESGLKIDPTRDVATSVKDRAARPEEAVAAAEEHDREHAEQEFSEEEIRLLDSELKTVTPPSARLALQLALRTAQRRLTVVSALKNSFVRHDTYGLVWRVHPGILKVGRTRHGRIRRHPHVLPLPYSVQAIVQTAMDTLTRPDNPYLFPQLRLRRAGDPGTAHLSERLLNAALADIQKLGRPLNRSQQFSTHAFRGWFTTHMRRQGFSKVDRKLILDHSEGRDRDTTDEHYDWEQSLPEKSAILRRWNDMIGDGRPLANSEDTPSLPIDFSGFGTSSDPIVPG